MIFNELLHVVNIIIKYLNNVTTVWINISVECYSTNVKNESWVKNKFGQTVLFSTRRVFFYQWKFITEIICYKLMCDNFGEIKFLIKQPKKLGLNNFKFQYKIVNFERSVIALTFFYANFGNLSRLYFKKLWQRKRFINKNGCGDRYTNLSSDHFS